MNNRFLNNSEIKIVKIKETREPAFFTNIKIFSNYNISNNLEYLLTPYHFYSRFAITYKRKVTRNLCTIRYYHSEALPAAHGRNEAYLLTISTSPTQYGIVRNSVITRAGIMT